MAEADPPAVDEHHGDAAHTEGELPRSREFLRSIVENIPDMVFVKDATELRFVRLNTAGEELLGYSRSEMIGKNDFDLFPAEEAEFFTRKDREVLAGRSAVDIPIEPIATRHRGQRILHTKKIPIIGPGGEPEYLLGISEDITEKIEAQQALEDARAAAEKANHAKSEFLSRMSHELRTPLNTVLGFAQLLEMDLTDDTDLQSVHHILTAGTHLLELINDVLDISRIEAGILSVSLEPVGLVDLVNECVDLVRPQASEHDITITTSSGSDSPIVATDRQRLRQVLLNLLSNAIKFNREGGRIELDCVTHDVAHRGGARQEPRVVVSVTDTGCGIDPQRINGVFTPYDRLGAETTDVEGTGLGLALSKRLCDAMGAELMITSPHSGGCRAEIDLPVQSAGAEPGSDPTDHDVAGSEVITVEGAVLHIEDNAINAELVSNALARRPGIEVLEARSGSDGLAMARERIPDLVLLDAHLPDLPGWKVLEELRSNARTAGIPVAVLSADATAEQIERFQRGGAADYLTKPLDVRRLLALVDSLGR